jgi:hypothetical protein
MDNIPIAVWIALGFPFAFASFWVVITVAIGAMMGWPALLQRFPDRKETAIKQFTWRSGRMGPLGASINNILRLDVCPSGLRVALPWLFAITSRPFFVPWDEIQVTKVDGVFFNEARLQFGRNKVGTLTIRESLANELAAAAPNGKWRG